MYPLRFICAATSSHEMLALDGCSNSQVSRRFGRVAFCTTGWASNFYCFLTYLLSFWVSCIKNMGAWVRIKGWGGGGYIGKPNLGN